MDGRNPTKKVFIQRDYSQGIAVKFSTEFPHELHGKVDETAYNETINHINELFRHAEALTWQVYCEGCMGCLTGYLSHYCCKTSYEKRVEEVAQYIRNQNAAVFEQHGIIIGDPMDRGLRCIEVNIIQERHLT
ncbi:hypothetical protein EMCRGX_G029371 [Ephydatia muelleri]|eukprot:Em0013g406a